MARFTGAAESTGGNGSALNYVQVAGGQATISSAPASIIDLDITTTGKPVQISVTGEASNASAGSWVKINLFRDGTAIGNEIQIEASAISENVPYAINFIDDVAAGTYNYSVRATSKASGNWTFGEVTGPVMNAVELTGFKGDTGETGPQGIQGEPGTGGSGDLVIPFTMKDENGDDLLGFEKGGTGVTRINALQDDLALRSTRDIILYPGDDGPGNVYINWGDAEYTPDSTNRVATIADIQLAGTGDITFVDNTISSETGDDIVIQNKNNDDVVKARITLDQSNEQVLIEAMNQDSYYYNSGSWSSATWTGNTITINGTPDIINFFDNVPGNITGVSVNNGTTVQYDGASYGSENIGINVIGTPPSEEDPLTVTEIIFYYNITSKIDINYDNGSFDIISKSMSMVIDSDGDLELNARDEDIDLRANDDIRFTANWNTGETEPQWRLTNSGRFELPGAGYISNPENSSGDGYGNDTLELIPDSDLLFESSSNQYIIIDPTAPNHIHLRAGGTQDESTADLFLGAERTNVRVSDGTGDVQVTSKRDDSVNSYVNLNPSSNNYFTTTMDAVIEFDAVVNIDNIDYRVVSVQYDTPDTGYKTVEITDGVFISGNNYTFRLANGENYWTFDSNGTLYGPTEPGWLQVSGIYGEAGSNTYIYSQENLILSTDEDQGVYINDANDGNNQIATIGDLASVGSPDGNTVTIQTKRDTQANWASSNPVLAAGEQGYETDTGLTKHGDGTNAWNNLTYSSTSTETYFVSNNTGSTITKGTLVSAVGAQTTGRIDIAPFDVSGTEDSEVRAMGLALTDIADGGKGTVISFGTLRNINTLGTTATGLAVGDETWSVGDILFAHPTANGKLTKVRPQHDLTVAFVTKSDATTGQIAVRINPGNHHLEWLHDVVLDSPADNEVLAFDSTSGLWKNQTAAEAGLQTRVLNVSDAEIGYLANVTSDIQTQINEKAALGSPTITMASFVSASSTTDPVTISTANGHGGAGFAGLMKLENSTAGATNTKKFIRMNSSGALEIVNDAYSQTIFSLADNGNLSGLGTINSATIEDTGWQVVSSFSNGYSGNSVAYRRVNNVLYLRGNISGGTANTAAFTLPTGYRPSTIEHVVLVQKFGTQTGSYVTVATNGDVVPMENAAWLSGISYPLG